MDRDEERFTEATLEAVNNAFRAKKPRFVEYIAYFEKDFNDDQLFEYHTTPPPYGLKCVNVFEIVRSNNKTYVGGFTDDGEYEEGNVTVMVSEDVARIAAHRMGIENFEMVRNQYRIWKMQNNHYGVIYVHPSRVWNKENSHA